MNQPTKNELSARLAAHVESLAEASDEAIEQAQQRLLARLPAERATTRPRQQRWRWLALASVSAVLVLAIAPLLVGRGDAFAMVQERLRTFSTMAMSITTRANGEVLQTSRTIVDASGMVRTDVGTELSVIVDPGNRRVLTLLHSPKQALLTPLPADARAKPPEASLNWLDELRQFQGKTTALTPPRQINGQPAYGWRLELPDSQLELWANAEGWPQTMQMTTHAGITLDFEFVFNQAPAAGAMSSALPTGYVMVDADED
jgi:hypothetical protein